MRVNLARCNITASGLDPPTHLPEAKVALMRATP